MVDTGCDALPESMQILHAGGERFSAFVEDVCWPGLPATAWRKRFWNVGGLFAVAIQYRQGAVVDECPIAAEDGGVGGINGS